MAAEKKELTINEKLTDIQVNFKAAKSRFNSFGKYNFRSAEDILEALKPFLVKHNVTVVMSETLKGNADNVNSSATEALETHSILPVTIIESKATISDGNDAIHSTALVGVDYKQKGMQIPQAFGSASSYGKKYALGNLFLIDDTQDSDGSNTHGKMAEKVKIDLKMPSDQYTAALKYIKEGGEISAIETKYKMSKAVKTALTTAGKKLEPKK